MNQVTKLVLILKVNLFVFENELWEHCALTNPIPKPKFRAHIVKMDYIKAPDGQNNL